MSPLSFKTQSDLQPYSNLTSAIWVFDLEKRSIWWSNINGLAFWGVTANQDLTEQSVSVESGIDWPFLSRAFTELPETGSRHYALDLHPRGTREHVTISCQRATLEGGRPGLLAEVVSEIPRLYHEEKARNARLEDIVSDRTKRLRQTEERIERALQVAAIWDWDIEADKLYFSMNFIRLLQYEPKEFIQKLRADRFEGIVHPDDYRTYLPLLDAFLANPDTPLSHEMRFVTKSGQHLWIQIEGKCFCDAEGKPERTAGLLTNVSPKKDIEANLLASQKLEAIGRLTGGIAHDFNNLLTVIQGNAQLLDEQSGVDRELTSEIVSAVDKGAMLTRHLLAFARKQSLNPKAFSIATLADNMRTTLLRVLSGDIHVTFEGPKDLWHIFADEAQTEAAILNIALNARDAMPNGGSLTITAENMTIEKAPLNRSLNLASGEYVRIAISDTGTGLAPDVIAKAFEPFFTTKDVGKGSGLGLSMVLGFSQQSGGDTSISSRLGLGTTVSIYLPKAKSKRSTAEVSQDVVPRAGHSEHVHVLEDNQQVNVAVSRMISSLNYKVSTSGNVDEALAAAKNSPDIAVFLVDVILPDGKSGVDFAHEVIKTRPFSKLILMSGFPQAQLVRDVANSLEFEFLPKPFSREVLSKVLAETLCRNA